jgi:formylglycine-generating enzyme required for sulfatase activity/energy-coupling factor transporter ATP-binding protein EcfA2
MMDISCISALPEPAKSILGSLAVEITKLLMSAAGYQVKKRLQTDSKQAALTRAMTEALAVTVSRLTEEPELIEHYLEMMRTWMSREVVIGELTQVIDPRNDPDLDFESLRSEFEAAGYDPDLLGEGVKFENVIVSFVAAFRDAAAKEDELQGQIEIGLLSKLVELTKQMVNAMERAQQRFPAHGPVVFHHGDEFCADIIQVYQATAGQAKLSEKDVKNILSEYLDCVARAYDSARLFGMESAPVARPASVQKLTDVFIPLTLRRFSPLGRRELDQALGGKTGVEALSAHYKLVRSKDRAGEDVSLHNLLPLSDRLAIVGGAGSGKSTVLAFLASTLARAAQTGEVLSYKLPERRFSNKATEPYIPVPLLVPLRYYRDYLDCCNSARQRQLDDPRTGTLAGFIPWYLQRRSPALELSEDFFDRLLLGGGCLLMIDGLDEVVNREQRGQVRQEVEDLLRNTYPNNRVIVTAREAGYREEAVFGDDFTRLDVQDLGEDQIVTLVGNWCRRLYAEDVEGNTEKLVQAIRYINALRQERDLPPLISTPLMTTMVVSVQWGETELPRERARLYEAATKAIIQAQYIRDDTARSGLINWGGSWEAQRDWLSEMALAMHEEGRGGATVRKEKVRTVLGRMLSSQDLDAFIRAVRYRGGLFEERAEFFQFIHLTFQEFLAARLLAKRREEGRKTLACHVDDSWWREVFLLTYGYLQMDYAPAAAAYLDWLSHIEGSAADRLGGAELAGAAVLEMERPDPELRCRQAERLVELLEDANLLCPGPLRAAAGRVLAKLGDPRPGVGLDANGLPDIAWCDIEPGPFIMGRSKEQAKYDDEIPQFTCNLIRQPYCISKYPVTNEQFNAFVKDGGYTEQWRQCWTDAGRAWKGNSSGPEKQGGAFDLPNHPVVRVRWYEAVAFCNWLSERLGYRVSLPTEAQWERAARHTDGRVYPWGNKGKPGRHCNMNDAGIGTTSTVGIFPAGNAECGAADMAGNVLEWCGTKRQDSYEGYERKADDTLDGGELRVLRGGAFYSGEYGVRCAYHGGYGPYYRNDSLGFRVVASPSTPGF